MRDRSRRPILALATALAFALQLALVPPVAACSCMEGQPMAAYAADDTAVIFTAVVDQRDARGFPVTVTRWFQGGGILDGRVWFDVNGFNVQNGMMSSCGIDPLPVGAEWVFVAHRIEGSNNLGMGLCSPHAPLAAAEGQAMLADALTTFGGAPIVPGTTDPPTTSDPAPGDAVLGAVIAIVVALVAGAGVLLGVFVVLGRRRERGIGPNTD